MKVKTIEKIISKKMDGFLGSIVDQSLRRQVRDSLIVTGGCITSMLQKEPVNDFDVYLSDSDVAAALATYLIRNSDVVSPGTYQVLNGDHKEDIEMAGNLRASLEEGQVKVHIRSAGVAGDPDIDEDSEINEIVGAVEEEEEGDRGSYCVKFVSPNAITLSDKIQIITRFTGDPAEIHKNFDFVHAFNYWTRETGLVLNVESLSSVIGKTLVYKGSRYPVSSLIRTRKFISRGWTINAGQYVKMAVQASQLDLLDPAVLEEQLIGVDSTYFAWFLCELNLFIEQEKSRTEEESVLLDVTYVMQVIDKIFG